MNPQWLISFDNEYMHLLAVTMMETRKELRNTPGAPLTTQISASITVILSFALGAGGAAWIPFPVVDIVSVIAIQVAMLTSIGAIWCIPVRKFPLKSLPLIVGPAGVTAAALLKGSVAKFIPLIGHITGSVVNTALGAGITAVFGMACVVAFAELTSRWSFEKLHGMSEVELIAALSQYANTDFLCQTMNSFITPAFARAVFSDNWRDELRKMIENKRRELATNRKSTESIKDNNSAEDDNPPIRRSLSFDFYG